MTPSPIQRFRLDADLWEQLGDLLGTRDRSAALQEFVKWRLAHPAAELPDAPAEQVVDLMVRIRLSDAGRKVEVVPFASSNAKAVVELREEVVAAIVDHFQEAKAAAAKTTRRKK